MYNSLLALGAAAVTFVLGLLASGWIAGVFPALAVGGIVWFLLARRTGQQLQPVLLKAQELAQQQKIAEAKVLLGAALPLAKWQFLVQEQIHMQLGALTYLEAVMKIVQQQRSGATELLQEARGHFEIASPSGWRSYLLGWQPRAMLAAVRHRQGDSDAALQICADAARSPRTEPIFWALYAWLLNELKRRDEALEVLGRGLGAHAGNTQLTAMRDDLANRRRPDMVRWGESWYQFFPEDMRHDPKVIELARAQQARQAQQGPKGRYSFPQPRR